MSNWMEFLDLRGDPFSNADEPLNYNDPSLSSIIVETKALKEIEDILFKTEKIE